jgi:glycosyltransferase involved in cell wall biosynthesis
LNHQKGFDLLLKAFNEVHRDIPDWRLVIVGEGEERKSLQNYIDANNLSDKIFLIGVRRDVGELFFASDLFVLSSRYEGFPNVLLEAITCELPCVSFDCPTGPRDIFRILKGRLVQPIETLPLAHAIKELAQNSTARDALRNHPDQVRQAFARSTIIHQWHQALKLD